jgi:hypothetical protein
VFAIGLTAEWAAWVAALAAPLHRRSAWRLAAVVAGILLAQGRRNRHNRRPRRSSPRRLSRRIPRNRPLMAVNLDQSSNSSS